MPSAFGGIQPLAQLYEDNFICCLCLPIGLWMFYRACDVLVNELSAIVCYNGMWYTIFAYNVLPHELLDLLGRDGG